MKMGTKKPPTLVSFSQRFTLQILAESGLTYRHLSSNFLHTMLLSARLSGLNYLRGLPAGPELKPRPV